MRKSCWRHGPEHPFTGKMLSLRSTTPDAARRSSLFTILSFRIQRPSSAMEEGMGSLIMGVRVLIYHYLHWISITRFILICQKNIIMLDSFTCERPHNKVPHSVKHTAQPEYWKQHVQSHYINDDHRVQRNRDTKTKFTQGQVCYLPIQTALSPKRC